MEHISNEEKARILSNKGCLGAYISKDAEALNPTEETKKRLSIYGACLEAMQWKDEQYKELKEATQTLYESARKVAQLYEPLQLALNKVFWEINIKQEL